MGKSRKKGVLGRHFENLAKNVHSVDILKISQTNDAFGRHFANIAKMEEDAARCQIKGLVILRNPPTEKEGGGTRKKMTQCKRVEFGRRKADPTRQYNTRRVQLVVNPPILIQLLTLFQPSDTVLGRLGVIA